MSLLKGKSGLGLGTKLGASLGTSQSELNVSVSCVVKERQPDDGDDDDAIMR